MRFKESFHGGTADGGRPLAPMTMGETASYETIIANWLVNDLKVAERVVATVEPSPEAA